MTGQCLIETVGYDDGDIDTNLSTTTHLNELVSRRYSRRSLMGGMSAMTTAVFGGALLTGCGDDDRDVITVSDGTTVQAQGGRVVTLSATASDNASTTTFTQVAGPTVPVVASGNSITFIAPNVAQATALVFEFSASGRSGTSSARSTVNVVPATLDFTAVAKNRNDVVTVPSNYNVTVLYRLGDPIAAGVSAYANNGTDANFAQRAGDHHDGMSYFGLAATGTTPDLAGNVRGILVMNHENITEGYLHPNGPTGLTSSGVRPEAEAIKEIEAHGVSVVEVTRAGNTGAWSYVQASTLNRRITPNTPMQFTGPARGSAALRTRVSNDGTRSNGTINNCANGHMPWNTYATCEENWAGYFTRAAGDEALRTAAGVQKENASLRRYGIGQGRTGNYRWTTVTPADASSTTFSRWNASILADAAADGTQDFRNEPFTFGWVVEIDPYNPQSLPRKRTALGRMNHEGCQPGRTVAGIRPAFYMGDDAQNEYIYKFVSDAAWADADATATDRLAIGDKYLDAGTLYVAKFADDGTGTWLPLVFGQGPLTPTGYPAYAFADQADVVINTRLAADALGATPMDRPEWTAVNPVNGEMYCTLTNNGSRTVARVDPSNPRAYVDPPSTSVSNRNGHVIRLRETGDRSDATTFTWDIYAFGAGSDLDPTNINLSALDATNDFSSPDGLWFGLPTNASGQVAPLMWLQTDDGAFTDVTNNQMLVGMPGRVGDGGTRQVTSTGGGASRTVTTRVGAAPGTKLKRFLVGPVECEITGISSTPDGRSLFVNVQHPGGDGDAAKVTSNWPASQAGAATGSRPRSATVVITKADGGVVGL
ncbi:phosphatase [Sphingomonas sp. Leaf231]|uniref:PhoX family protein n=1 Tax=Sphingomonas sp. Leaf231 TaxID=1736301 RepID=UPI0006F537DA|nr:PhoX family phosphatase [Sphingomonas sp. Leaf231]KQN94000.1 phosphatase [Sphingomonas sp. Leaf231]